MQRLTGAQRVRRAIFLPGTDFAGMSTSCAGSGFRIDAEPPARSQKSSARPLGADEPGRRLCRRLQAKARLRPGCGSRQPT
jgi:hypothetical protein